MKDHFIQLGSRYISPLPISCLCFSAVNNTISQRKITLLNRMYLMADASFKDYTEEVLCNLLEEQLELIF